jgi:DNA-binding CsgD family transcriptional regulator
MCADAREQNGGEPVEPPNESSKLYHLIRKSGSGQSRLEVYERDIFDADRNIERRVARLTEGQRLCLLLVAEHRSSKEIARHLGISSHTVDQRIRTALKTLGVRQRAHAARLLIHSLEAEPRSSAVLPWATRRHPRNEMSSGFRLFWIAAIAGTSALLAGLFLAALESLSALLGRR